MINQAFSEIFERNIDKLIAEINLYKNEEDLWIVRGEISNSAGNLCLHLIGNLNHFIGFAIGKTGYLRNRDEEFSQKNIPRATLISNLENTKKVVKSALQNLNIADLEKDFPVEMQGKIQRTDFMLLHLLAHLSYHLGQVNYHRRLL